MTNPTTPDWLREGFKHIWLPYANMNSAPMPTAVVGAHDSRLVLADGRELIDGCASWWTACHGYNHPHIRAAIEAQLQVFPHVMFGGLANEAAYGLAKRLADLAPGDLDRVFLAESGSVSVEVAMKMAIQYWMLQGEPNRTRFLSFDHGYHGDTFGTMGVGDLDGGMHHVFKGALLTNHHTAVPQTERQIAEFESLLDRHQSEIAAVLIEPLVQGAGGFRFHDEATLRYIREATERHNILLIADEIMTGFGRTGTMFACCAAGVVPDIMTVSKALTGGTLPLSAAISSVRVGEAFYQDRPEAALMHGPTYMGNALACAAAQASLDLFEHEPRLAQIEAVEKRLSNALQPAKEIPGVVDVRVRGAIGVIQVTDTKDVTWLKKRFVEEGVFVRPLEDVIYVTPAFNIPDTDLDRLADALLTVTTDWSARFC